MFSFNIKGVVFRDPWEVVGMISPPTKRSASATLLLSDFGSLTVRGLRTALPPLAGSGGFAPLSKEK